MAEKTEKATPKKLKDARKKGQVAKIQDVPSALTFVVSMIGALASVSFFFEELGSFTLLMFREVSQGVGDFETRGPGYFYQAMEVIMKASLPLMVLVCFVGVLTSFLVIG
ncbi:MAG TPA: EscU/YscU/HrcU family type III secretion system export apparatus switch protein, partial [Chlamydiales bacterium]